ncbi:hypothetical protein PV08_08541 [Exophiala spinifera]|uniref:PRISE-like Rossmann-fold domain-containing protein n=1 Tax=Exophiala spinifera TaxID=91928 RepID=A0A0D2B347_9EURO|nr:uncharacterized protein PV08_08541 [Exophiala spinifera]KIW13353.1 hypothetical protein PV08_08541 [Exophiala spinifera]
MTTPASAGPYQALIFGASGISGWAITRAALLSTDFKFSKVVGLTRRPLSIQQSSLPTDSRLALQSGLDLGRGQEAVTELLGTIQDIERTSHVYFTAYIHGAFGETKDEARTRINVEILRTAIGAVEQLCPKLQFWVLQSGAKWYGTEFSEILKPKAPFRESAPRIPSPYGDHIFYYPQFDLLEQRSRTKDWTFANIIPDSIVGFVPANNPMTIAHPIALYLAMWKKFRETTVVAFPGTSTSYKTLHTDSSSDTLGNFTIYVSMHAEQTSGRNFNIADNDGVTWEDTWDGICSYFGLKGGPPNENAGFLQGENWILSLKPRWAEFEKETGLRSGVLETTPWEFFTIIVGYYSEINRNLDISEARKIGFPLSGDAVKSYHDTFDRLRVAKMIP